MKSDFDEWFHETEPGTFSLRAERCYDDIIHATGKDQLMRLVSQWMKAAFDAGANNVDMK